MGHKPCAEDLSEALHLGGDSGIGTGALSDNDAGVVDDTPLAGASHETEGLREEVAGFETGEGGVVLNEGSSAVGKDKGGALGGNGFTRNKEPVGGGVVLSLLSGSKAVGAHPLGGIFLEVG